MGEAAVIAAKFEETFERIRVERMAGVPILNPALSVAMTELRDWEGFHAGVLVTPWFINVVLIARQEEDESPVTGTKKCFLLPAGSFEFIRCEEGDLGEEDGLGGFWMCSLFSPALEFGDMETAVEVAEASLAALMDGEAGEAEDEDMQRIWRGELPEAEEVPAEDARDDAESRPRQVSRRAFLTAGAARDNAPDASGGEAA